MSMNIYQKINAIMGEIQYLSKDDKVEFGNTKYKALSEEKVTGIVREKLVKYGLVLYPTSQTVMKEGQITTTNTTYIMVNMENPEEKIEIASSGQGSDSQDKGVGKAMTYSYKYALLRTFAIPTGEDPDKISSEELSAKYAEEESKDPVAEDAMARKVILALGTNMGKDEAYTIAWCEKLFGNTYKWEQFTEPMLAKCKVELSKKLQKQHGQN